MSEDNYPTDPIAYLLKRKFGLAADSVPSCGLPDVEQALEEQLHAERDSYQAELLALPELALEVLVHEEFKKEKREERELEECSRFFHEASADADYAYWAKMPQWALEEAVALSLGKDPTVVTWAKVEPYVQVSPFASSFDKLRRRLLRTNEAGKLFNPISPSAYIDWAAAAGIELPAKLKENVEACGSSDGTDWKQLHEISQAQLEEVTSELMRFKSAQAPVEGKRRGTYQKFILGLAAAAYGYDPREARSSATKQIATT